MKHATIVLIALITALATAAPVVLTGKDFPHLIGKPVSSIRIIDMAGNPVTFQIDEVAANGEYVLDKGEEPNIKDGNGILDEKDEIVFLWGDADISVRESTGESGLAVITRGSEKRFVIIRADPSLPLSAKRHVEYDHAAQRVTTPYYYADFAKNRFHFLKAGVKDFKTGRYIDLTNELRVEILLRTLFGLIPVRYSEDNIVCTVKRYKVGPVRLIRRGDFHLNLGLGVKGSKAAVNQICYAQIVKVPVYVSLPIRFRTLFSHAHIEMTPVIREAGEKFYFSAPSENIILPVGGGMLDSLYAAVPTGKMFTVRSGNAGYGWLLNTTMNRAYLSGSGFVMRRPPPERTGIAECGFRLAVKDVPKGSYYITNWVIFSGGKNGDIERLGKTVNLPINILEVKD